MGALHAGHLSLVQAAKETGKKVLVSVFVNPAQFGPNEDFDAYPRNHEEDAKKLKKAGVSAVWFPTEEDIYPNGERPYIHTLPHVFSELEGAIRPTHFLGVAQVLHSFFSLVEPEDVFFGQKDYQQTVLVRWLLKEYFPDITLNICPIIRESNGLAMSSRNEYLTDTNRYMAKILFSSLQEAKKMWKEGERNPSLLEARVASLMQKSSCVEMLDYAEIRHSKTFTRFLENEATEKAVFVLVARIQGVRLLDNILL